jgi:hypothetical protein
MADTTHCPGLLVIELGAPAPAGALLPTEVASALADHVAADLARLVPGAAMLDLALSGAPLDPAQVLRPGWPVFAELGAQLARTRRGLGSRIVAFGGAGGRMVSHLLEADAAVGLGPLVVLPFVLAGDAEQAQRTGAQLEELLHEHGLAGAAVALLLQQALGIEVVHARYFTHHDLAALVAIQLDHAGCAGAWSLLEAALFAPGKPVSATAASGQRWQLQDGTAYGTAIGLREWRAGPGANLAPADHAGAFAAWQAEQRRHAALFAAHGLAIAWRDGNGAPLSDPWLLLPAAGVASCANASDPVLVQAHEAPGLGSYAFSATRGTEVLATCYPLAVGALAAARDALCARVGAAAGAPLARSRELPAF